MQIEGQVIGGKERELRKTLTNCRGPRRISQDTDRTRICERVLTDCRVKRERQVRTWKECEQKSDAHSLSIKRAEREGQFQEVETHQASERHSQTIQRRGTGHDTESEKARGTYRLSTAE
jgi:hypothetical protein